MSLATPQRTKKQTTVFKILAFQGIYENERRNVCLKAWCVVFFFFSEQGAWLILEIVQLPESVFVSHNVWHPGPEKEPKSSAIL